jgi:hypothetical protein
MILAIFTHPLLDLFTTYGTQLLSPLSNHRFALDAVAIIDPIYTLMLVGAVGVGAWRGWGDEASRACAWAALVLSAAYLFYALALNDSARNRAEEQLIADGVRPTAVSAYPTLLQPWFRRVVARTDQGIHVGWISLWQPRPIEWLDDALVERLVLVFRVLEERVPPVGKPCLDALPVLVRQLTLDQREEHALLRLQVRALLLDEGAQLPRQLRA